MEIKPYKLADYEKGCRIGVRVMLNGHIFKSCDGKSAAHEAERHAHRLTKCLEGSGVVVALEEYPYTYA